MIKIVILTGCTTKKWIAAKAIYVPAATQLKCAADLFFCFAGQVDKAFFGFTKPAGPARFVGRQPGRVSGHPGVDFRLGQDVFGRQVAFQELEARDFFEEDHGVRDLQVLVQQSELALDAPLQRPRRQRNHAQHCRFTAGNSTPGSPAGRSAWAGKAR